jgi:pimeloyl-ACP methyl ester carboxylesterase
MATTQPLTTLEQLTARFDASVFELGRPSARIRLTGAGPESSDVLLDGRTATLEPADAGKRPDAVLSADADTWAEIARDLRGGMSAYRDGRLKIRRDLHLGVGFLAATASTATTAATAATATTAATAATATTAATAATDGTAATAGPAGNGARNQGGLRFRSIETSEGAISSTEAGTGTPVLLLHGLGATKVSMLPSLAALASGYRAIAVDLPGFGDSVKPIRARYDAAYFARVVVALLDALELETAHLVGNSMGGRVALEVGLRTPERVGRLGLLAPSLAWLRDRPLAPLLRLVAPQLGLIQPAPRAVVEAIVRRVIPGARDEWAAAGIDEFLRAYLTPRGRAAFYGAARNIYLEEPHGPRGLWTRLPDLEPPSLFVWGKRDRLVPIRFADHVREALPGSQHLELDCGHVPQLERPKPTHAALRKFFDAAAL